MENNAYANSVVKKIKIKQRDRIRHRKNFERKQKDLLEMHALNRRAFIFNETINQSGITVPNE